MGVGNDIVDLNFIDIQRTCNPKFHAKFLSPAELALHCGKVNSIAFEYFIWVLWSVKEAAYKCLKRCQPDLVFSPVKLAVATVTVSEDGDLDCVIDFNDQRLFARSIIDVEDRVIHTVACFDDDFAGIHSDFRRIENTDPESQSTAVRKILLTNLPPQYAGADLRIDKSDTGIPYLFMNGLQQDLPLSLSHHGNWVGYAYYYQGGVAGL